MTKPIVSFLVELRSNTSRGSADWTAAKEVSRDALHSCITALEKEAAANGVFILPKNKRGYLDCSIVVYPMINGGFLWMGQGGETILPRPWKPGQTRLARALRKNCSLSENVAELSAPLLEELVADYQEYCAAGGTKLFDAWMHDDSTGTEKDWW